MQDRLRRPFAEDPGILCPPSLRAVDDQASFRQSDPREPAGHDLDLLPVKYEWPEVDMAAFEAVLDERRMLAQGDCRLSDIGPWIRLDFRAELLTLLSRRGGTDE